MNLFGFTHGEDSFCTETGTGKRGHEKQDHPRNAVQEFSCLYCGSDKASVFLGGCRDYYMGKPGLFDYYTCANCGLIQLYPIPLEMSPFYESYDVHAAKSLAHQMFRRLLMSKGYYFPPEVGPKLEILDYGAGDGWYLRQMARRGHRVSGFEDNAVYASALSKRLELPIYSEQESLLGERESSFDLVTMHFVLEHLPALEETFALIQRLLNPGGSFYFVIPNIRSIEFKIFKRKWHALDPPRHIMFPTSGIVKKVAEKTGFNLRHVEYLALPNGLAGSLSTILAGRFVYPLFAALILPSLLACLFLRDEFLAVTLQKNIEE